MRTVTLKALAALKPGESWFPETDDVRTPERFMNLGAGPAYKAKGNEGSILLISGSVHVQFENGDFVSLHEGDVYHCRTPETHSVVAGQDSIIKILGEHRESDFDVRRGRWTQIYGSRMVWTGTEAYYALGQVAVGEREMQVLRNDVKTSPRQRVRLCTHKNANSPLHEMFVCYTKTTDIAPHKHLAKDESFHVLEGELDFVMFNETGDVTDIIPMGDKNSGKPFYVRVPRDTYHTVSMTSEFCILHEGTPGPFLRSHTVWADWGKR